MQAVMKMGMRGCKMRYFLKWKMNGGKRKPEQRNSAG